MEKLVVVSASSYYTASVFSICFTVNLLIRPLSCHRFIIDDAALYLSDKCSGSANIRSKYGY